MAVGFSLGYSKLVDDDPPLFKSSSQLALLSDSMELYALFIQVIN